MSTAHVEALSQSESLRQKSDENLIVFYRQELRMIGSGRKASDLFNSSVIRNLTRLGLLKHIIGKGKGRGLALTDKARELLENR